MSSGRLEGKVALVTGAGSGLGAAITRRFHQEGAFVFVNDLNKATAEAVAEEVGGFAIVADVADSSAVSAMFAQVASRVEHLDILVNNAGINGYEHRPELLAEHLKLIQQLAEGGPATTPLDLAVQTTDEDWHRMLAVHIDGTFFCCRESLKLMIPQMSGAIINMSSVAGTYGAGPSPSYCAAKSAILGLTRALAHEAASRNIRINALAPGWIDGTNMTRPFRPVLNIMTAQTPLGHSGDPDDIAWAAVYLASDEAKFVTGQVLSPNGGVYMSQ